MILLAVIGGYLGCLFTTFNTWVCLVRKRWSKYMWARVLEVCIISVITSTVRFVAPAMGTCMPCETTDNEHCVSGELWCLAGCLSNHLAASGCTKMHLTLQQTVPCEALNVLPAMEPAASKRCRMLQHTVTVHTAA